MIKKAFWQNVAEVWTRKETILIPNIDNTNYAPPDDLVGDDNDYDELDDFLKDILCDFEEE